MNLFKKRFSVKTLQTKLRLALFATGFFPFVFILIYIHNLGEKKILNDTLTIHHTQIHMIKKSIENQLLSLQKELKFLSSLEIMNDMIVSDVDKRIAQILLQKKEDLNLKIELYALDTNSRIVASTTHEVKTLFTYKKRLLQILETKKNYFFKNNNLYLISKIQSNLQKETTLGYLIIKYSLSNLDSFSIQQKGIRSLFYFPVLGLKIGQMFDNKPFKLTAYKNDFITSKYLILNEQFNGVLSKGFIVYMIKKSVALSFLDEFMKFVWIVFILGFIIIGFLSWWISKRILQPIAKLSTATQSIIDTQDYTTQVALSSEGEIKELADNFNAMIREINQSFTLLEEENKVRLLRFIQLINIFNRLIQTKSEKTCINLVLEELQTLVPQQTFTFSSEYPKKEESLNLMLYVKDYEKELSHFYGVISVSGSEKIIDVEEIRFYKAVATMIMLQLDQIRLIAQTKAVSSAKSTFISHMSHELRTPLHTILSSTQYLIGYEGLSLSQQEKIATIESSADHLLGMINDILDLVQIEAGKISVHAKNVTTTQVENILEEVIAMLNLLAEQKGLTLKFNNQLKKSINVLVDEKFLKQILINLLSNAIKFTNNGHIEVVMQENDKRLCITVKDSGIGLSQNSIESLFNEFTQFNHENKNTQKGSGLGLAISKKLAHLFEADIILESKGIGEGTTAILTLKII